MQKKRIITISGMPGSGKSTASKELAAILKYERFSSGDAMRTIAHERGISITDLNAVAETDSSLDKEIDRELREMGETRERIIIDSRLAFHWMPYSFKVYLNLSPLESAKRIFNDNDDLRVKSELHSHVEDALKNLTSRLVSEQKRYREAYGVDPYDSTQFDLVVDTSNFEPTEVTRQIVHAYKAWLGTEI